MNKDRQAYEQLVAGIRNYINNSIDNAKFDTTLKARVVEIAEQGYNIEINGSTYYNIKTMGGSCDVGEIVYVLIPQGLWGEMKILKYPKGQGGQGGGTYTAGTNISISDDNKISCTINTSNFATTSALNNKVDKVTGKGLSTNDFTTELKTKLTNMTQPTKVSDLTNDSGFITNSALSSLATKSELNDYLKKVDETKTLTALTDVALPNPIPNTTILSWSEATGKWSNGFSIKQEVKNNNAQLVTGKAVYTALQAKLDATTTNPTTNQAIMFDGTNWVNKSITTTKSITVASSSWVSVNDGTIQADITSSCSDITGDTIEVIMDMANISNVSEVDQCANAKIFGVKQENNTIKLIGKGEVPSGALHLKLIARY